MATHMIRSSWYSHCDQDWVWWGTFRLKNLLWWLGRRGADQEDLIICVAIWTLYKLWVPLTSDDLRVGSIASRNKLRFTSLLKPIFQDFGGPNGLPNLIFEAFLFDVIFHCFWASNFGGFFEPPNQKNSNFTSRKQWFLQNWRFR